jgi:integrase
MAPQRRQARERDLPDLVDFLLATGLRVGEALAVTWDAVDLSAGTVEVRGTVIRVKGRDWVYATVNASIGSTLGTRSGSHSPDIGGERSISR